MGLILGIRACTNVEELGKWKSGGEESEDRSEKEPGWLESHTQSQENIDERTGHLPFRVCDPEHEKWCIECHHLNNQLLQLPWGGVRWEKGGQGGPKCSP